jgi:hypothetical protein
MESQPWIINSSRVHPVGVKRAIRYEDAKSARAELPRPDETSQRSPGTGVRKFCCPSTELRPIGARNLSTRSHCAYCAYGVDGIGAIDFSARNHCVYGVDDRSMVEVGLPTNCGRSVRTDGLFGPFAFRGECRPHRRFRRPALFTPIHAIDFSTRNRGIYSKYGGNAESMAESDPYIGSSRRSHSHGATLISRRSDTGRSESRSKKWRSVFELAVSRSLEAAGLANVSSCIPAVCALVLVL